MAITLKPKERDAIFAQISADFTLFGDLEKAIEEGHEEQCYILGRILSDGLRLLLDGGMGWRPRTGEPAVLTIPDEELAAIMERLRGRMVGLYESMRPAREGSQAEWDEIATIRDTASEVMNQARERG
ncbi:MAG TPA: hypothetical protein VG448_11620 [Solirubrobacterales bacterium]|nr:hypothetical protein [Solirubrobacterales bacterium]